MDISDFLPNGFNLRQGKGNGDPKKGLCFMETVALIAGEPITDHPTCACPVLTGYGIWMNDSLGDADRKRLLPLAWATAGTNSREHEFARMKILGLVACDIVEMALPKFEETHPEDNRPREAIEATRMFWGDQSGKTFKRLMRAHNAIDEAIYNEYKDSRNVIKYVLKAAKACIEANDPHFPNDAGRKACSAAGYAYVSIVSQCGLNYTVISGIRKQIVERQFTALRDAIKAGPNGGLPDEIVIERINSVRELLPVGA